MAEYSWPPRDETTLLGTAQDRIDAGFKATGAAKYAYDINPKHMLLARALGCPHAHCKVKSIDVTAAKKVPGVVTAKALKKPGDEIEWQGELLACVAGESEGAIGEGLKAIKVEYELLDVFVKDDDLKAAQAAGRTEKEGGKVQLVKEPGDDDDEDEFTEKELTRLFKESAVIVEGYYGVQAITHMCLEPHGSTCEWQGDKLTAHLSTQNVSGTAAQFAAPLGITADDVTVHCDYVGGGFGSKFAADVWGVAAAEMAKETGRPVKLMLDRDVEMKIAGARPSGFLQVKLGADKDGVVQVWDSHHWGTGGMQAGGVGQEVVPYVFTPPNFRRRVTKIMTNTGPVRAWRAPPHPQGCAMSQPAFDDVARKLGLDSYEVYLRNLVNVPDERRRGVYAEEMKVAARLMDWKAKWHPHGKGPAEGSIVSGLGMAIHTWGGGALFSNCNLKIHPDGGVEILVGSQDIGTGTRTVIAMVVGETLGLPVRAVKVDLGSSKYPSSGPSGGSTTVGGVSESSRRASQDALRKIFDLVAGKLKVNADSLDARQGRIRVKEKPDQGLTWKEACSLLGMNPLEVQGKYEPAMKTTLSSSGVAGVQMAEVAVDRETGEVRMKKFVAVQDMGLVVNRKTCSSQIYGAVIMGIAYSLFEERIMDPKTGAFLNADVKKYQLPRLGDIGEIVVELYEPESERSRGVIGMGEPPVISPGAAISNAVCNALGVRVPVLPLTPKRVLDTLLESEESLMKDFEYAMPESESEVLEFLSTTRGKTEVMAGGTDLVALMQQMIVTPDRVVSLAAVSSLRAIEDQGDGVRIGAMVTLEQLFDSPELEAYRALKQAIDGIGSQQYEAQGTLGGELCQKPHCWYFRGGHGLLADRGRMVVEGDNRYHAIFGNQGPAKFVSASRLAPALIALRATLRLIGPEPGDEQTLALEDFFRAPRHEHDGETVLQPGQIVTHLTLPRPAGWSSAAYDVRHGAGPDDPLASAAAALVIQRGVVAKARVVLGQVAPIPWMSADAVEVLLGQPVNQQVAEAAGDAAVASAAPLSDNAYKVQLARVAVKRAVLLAAGLETGGF